jgi:hypothetical protein
MLKEVMEKNDFSLWKKNIEKISLNKDVIKHLISNFSLAYNIECFNFLLKTQKYTAAGICQPYDLFINSLLLKKELNYDISNNLTYGVLDKPKRINLGFDPVFTYPWREDSITDCLLSIGEETNKFKMSANHNGIIILPYNICVITGGNHSILSGIIKKDGFIEINNTCNFSKIISDIDFDGEYFYLIKNVKKRVKTSSVLLGLIYYLGKYLK